MSIEAISKFRGCLAADPAWAQQCQALLRSGEIQQLLTLAQARGCVVDAGQAAEALEPAELSERELDLIAGAGSIKLPSFLS